MRHIALALAIPALALVASACDDAVGPNPPVAQERRAPEWTTDIDGAFERAAAAQRDVFVLFTGSGWSWWSAKLHDEVLSQPEFAPLAEEFVFVSIDIPWGNEARSRLPDAVRRLAVAHQVRDLPTVVLFLPGGQPYGEMGYQAGGATHWVAALTGLRALRRPGAAEVVALEHEFDAAGSEHRAEVLARIVARAERSGYAPRGFVPALRAASSIDPRNEAGLAGRALVLLFRSGSATEDDRALVRAIDPENRRGVREAVLRAEWGVATGAGEDRRLLADLDALLALDRVCDPELVRRLLVDACFVSRWTVHDDEAARRYATRLEALAGPDRDRYAYVLDLILGKPGTR